MKKDKEWLGKEVVKLSTTISNVDGKSEYVGISRNAVLNLTNQLDEPELPVIPQFVADWIEYAKKECATLSECLIMFNFDHKKAFDWINTNRLDREEVIAKAWLDDYAIEKEQFYYIKLPTKNDSLSVYVNYDVNEIVHFDNFEGTQFTEQEIKAIDERYWAFAEEVPND